MINLKGLMPIMVVFLSASILPISSEAGEVENVLACVRGAKDFAKVTLSEFDASYEGNYLRPSVVKWNSARCEVKLGDVLQLDIDGTPVIVNGFAGTYAETQNMLFEAKTDEAIKQLKYKIVQLEQRMDEASEQLSSPNPNHDEIEQYIDEGIKSALGEPDSANKPQSQKERSASKQKDTKPAETQIAKPKPSAPMTTEASDTQPVVGSGTKNTSTGKKAAKVKVEKAPARGITSGPYVNGIYEANMKPYDKVNYPTFFKNFKEKERVKIQEMRWAIARSIIDQGQCNKLDYVEYSSNSKNWNSLGFYADCENMSKRFKFTRAQAESLVSSSHAKNVSEEDKRWSESSAKAVCVKTAESKTRGTGVKVHDFMESRVYTAKTNYNVVVEIGLSKETAFGKSKGIFRCVFPPGEDGSFEIINMAI